jgi:hypothetical protein
LATGRDVELRSGNGLQYEVGLPSMPRMLDERVHTKSGPRRAIHAGAAALPGCLPLLVSLARQGLLRSTS